jgi:hypothetical protein
MARVADAAALRNWRVAGAPAGKPASAIRVAHANGTSLALLCFIFVSWGFGPCFFENGDVGWRDQARFIGIDCCSCPPARAHFTPD